MTKIKLLLNWLLNKNFAMKYLDGYKTQIAGILVGLAFILEAISGLVPPEVSGPLKAVAESLKQLAAYFGIVGGLGKVAKT